MTALFRRLQVGVPLCVVIATLAACGGDKMSAEEQAQHEAEEEVGVFVGHDVSCVLRVEQSDTRREWKCQGQDEAACFLLQGQATDVLFVTRTVDEPACPAKTSS